MNKLIIGKLFYIDSLSLTISILGGFIGVVVWCFARRYIAGEKDFKKSMLLIITIFVTIITTVITDNIFLFFTTYCLNNILLLVLMNYYKKWQASQASMFLASKYFLFSTFCLLCSLLILYKINGNTSIQLLINNTTNNKSLLTTALIFMILAAMTQSAIIPFHKWLLSSLNTSTPTSVLINAGIINGGGILFLRFAPLYYSNVELLNIIYMVGIFSAIIATYWQLIQANVKNMLTCSTIGQMGFMFVLYGMGLFSAAIVHLFWHSIFKAYLFLKSESSVKEEQISSNYPLSWHRLLFASCCGIVGCFAFIYTAKFSITTLNTNIMLIIMTFILGTQLAVNFLKQNIRRLIVPYYKNNLKFIIILLLTTLCGGFYGKTIFIMGNMLDSVIQITRPQPLNMIYLLGIILLITIWLIMLFKDKLENNRYFNQLLAWIYVKGLNASQPNHRTITTHNKNYHYM